MLDSVSFSRFGRTLERASPISLQELIELQSNGTIMPIINEHKNKLPLQSFVKRIVRKDPQISSSFNSVPRSRRPAHKSVQLEKSYEPKYSPRYDVIQSRSPAYTIQSRIVKRETKSQCSQDYYTLNYSSFNSNNNSVQQVRKSTMPRIKIKECNFEPQLSTRQVSNRILNVPDFEKQPPRHQQSDDKAQPAYDLLAVNYERLLPRLNVGYVQFYKFQNQIRVRSDTSEQHSARLSYEAEIPKKVRNISLNPPSPRNLEYPKLRPKLLPPGKVQRYSKVTKDLFTWLNSNL